MAKKRRKRKSETWAKPLTSKSMTHDFLELLRPKKIIMRIPICAGGAWCLAHQNTTN